MLFRSDGTASVNTVKTGVTGLTAAGKQEHLYNYDDVMNGKVALSNINVVVALAGTP